MLCLPAGTPFKVRSDGLAGHLRCHADGSRTGTSARGTMYPKKATSAPANIKPMPESLHGCDTVSIPPAAARMSPAKPIFAPRRTNLDAPRAAMRMTSAPIASSPPRTAWAPYTPLLCGGSHWSGRPTGKSTKQATPSANSMPMAIIMTTQTQRAITMCSRFTQASREEGLRRAQPIPSPVCRSDSLSPLATTRIFFERRTVSTAPTHDEPLPAGACPP